MITFLKQLVHEGEVMVIENVEEIAEKKDNGEPILQSNYAKCLTCTLMTTVIGVFLFFFFWGISDSKLNKKTPFGNS